MAFGWMLLDLVKLLLAQAASSALSGQGLQNQDAYWSLLDRRQGDPIIDANSWAADH